MSLFSMSYGKSIKLITALQTAGMDEALVEKVIDEKNTSLVKAWIADFRQKLAPPAPTHSGMFRSVHAVFEWFAAQAQANNWFTDGQLNQLQERLPRQFESTLEQAFSFDMWLGDLLVTCEEHKTLIAAGQKELGNGFWVWSDFKWEKEHLRLANPRRYGKTPSVDPVAVNLVANRKKAPRDVRDANAPVFGGMMAFAAHPQYPPSINCDDIPDIWVPGIEVDVHGWDSWSRVLCLIWNQSDRRVGLSALLGDVPDSRLAVPVLQGV